MTTMTPTLSSTAAAASGKALALKLTCKQEDLARALSVASRAVLPNSTAPILKNILVATEEGRLRLSATTLEIGIQVWIDAQIEQAGTTALPADLLTKMVSSFPAGTLTLSVPEGSQTLTLATGGSLSNIRGTDPSEFPIIPGIEAEQAAPVSIEAGLLKTMIEQVSFAASTDTSKAVWSSVKLELSGSGLTAAAADTFRVAERIAPLSGVAEAQCADFLVPSRNLGELARVLPSQGQVIVCVTPQKNQVVFRMGEGEQIDFVSRLIEGAYPPYQRLLQQQATTRAVVETKRLLAAVRRAALFAVDTKKSMRLTFKAGGGENLFGSITIEADDADLGNHVSTEQAEVSGPDQCIFFNAKYLEEALAHIDTPQVAVLVTESGRPVLLKPVSDVAYTSLVQTMAPS